MTRSTSFRSCSIVDLAPNLPGSFLHPDGYRPFAGMKLALSSLIDCHLRRMLPKPIDKGLPRMNLTDFHGLEACIAIAQYHRATRGGMLVISFSCPPDTVGMIQVVPLWPIGKPLPGLHKLFDIFTLGISIS